MSERLPQADAAPLRANARSQGSIAVELLGRIPRRSRHVVDIGCGIGALGPELKAFDPTIRVVGVEADAELAAEARRRLDRVVCGDVETLDPVAIAEPGSVDCIVYADILERLRDPWGVVRRHVPLLAREGLMVASVANFQHFRTLRELITGRWDYRRSGVSDIANLRHFVRKGAIALFRQAGLVVISCDGRVPPDTEEEHRRFVAAMKPALAELGVEAEDFPSRTAASHHLIVAALHARPVTLVQAITRSPTGGLTDVRITEPLEFVRSEPGVMTASDVHKANATLFPSLRDRVLVWQRPFLNAARDARKIARLIERGYVIVLEIDDNPKHRQTSYAVDDYFTFRAVHAIQVSTAPLEEVMRSFNPTTVVFPNQIARLPSFPDMARRAGVRLFFGAFNREDDWASLMPALNTVLARHPEVIVDVLHDQAFFDALETRSKSFHPLSDYADYKSRLGHADIALLPLSDTPFNRTKSDLKFIESAAHGAVALASPVVYGKTLVDGETGVLFADAATFAERLERLIIEPDMRHRLARQAYRYVAARRLLAQHYHERLTWYRGLLAQREELTDALLRRAPEVVAR